MDDGLQGFLGSILGFGVAIAAIIYTHQSEARKEKKQLESLKAALGAEVRQFCYRAMSGLELLIKHRSEDKLLTISDLEILTMLPEPIVYKNIVSNLGSLGKYSHHIVVFYGQWDLIQKSTQHVKKGRPEVFQVVDSVIQNEIGKALSRLIENAILILPGLKNGIDDSGDIEFSKKLIETRSKWIGYNAK